jgi:hypothetical protein
VDVTAGVGVAPIGCQASTGITANGYPSFQCAGLVVGTSGAPQCAPGLSPDQARALIAWRTWMPCNWFGVQVPTGTPGSWG